MATMAQRFGNTRCIYRAVCCLMQLETGAMGTQMAEGESGDAGRG